MKKKSKASEKKWQKINLWKKWKKKVKKSHKTVKKVTKREKKVKKSDKLVKKSDKKWGTSVKEMTKKHINSCKKVTN